MAAEAARRATPQAARPVVALGSRDRLLGETVARRIQREVIAAGWQIGTMLGSEAELLERYAVSRSVLREAVRLLEHLGVARMRRGPGGGLVVTKPDSSAVVEAVLAYMTYEQVSLDEVLGVRRPIEETSVRLAAGRRTDADVALLLRLTSKDETSFDDEFEFHRAIARTTGNPAIELFVEILNRVSAQFQAPMRLSDARARLGARQSARVHRRLAEAIAGGDIDAAQRRMGHHLEAMRGFLTERVLNRRLGVADVVSSSNGRGPLAPGIARQIYGEIVAKGWPVGHLLGSEAELLARHSVSRSVLREALRLLEFNGIVTTRRGLGGGIIVSRPDQAATVEAMASFIESRGITPEHLFEVREAIELAAVDLASQHIDVGGRQLLETTLEAERRGELRVAGQALHVCIAEITRNRVLHLFLYALTLLAEIHTLERDEINLTNDQALERVQRIHRAIVDAIVAGDVGLARHRMERHLVALVPHQH